MWNCKNTKTFVGEFQDYISVTTGMIPLHFCIQVNKTVGHMTHDFDYVCACVDEQLIQAQLIAWVADRITENFG